jgi:hypothetical protein
MSLAADANLAEGLCLQEELELNNLIIIVIIIIIIIIIINFQQTAQYIPEDRHFSGTAGCWDRAVV